MSAIVRPVTRPLVRPLTRRVTQPGFGGNKTPKPGDYLLDAKQGNYLTDELGNRLTA